MLPDQPSLTVEQLLRASGLSPTDARVLACTSLQWTRQQLITRGLEVLDPVQMATLQSLFARRRQGEPVAYLTGQREFFGLPFYVTPDVLIPRPDTELLVELAQAFIASRTAPAPIRIIDLGTGSGAIAVTLAHLSPNLQVTALDISTKALAVAQRNAERHPAHASSSLTLLQSDWFDALAVQDIQPAPLPPERQQFDLVISNPPYIERDDPHLAQGDLRFEPPGALTDHHDGLSAIRLIVSQSLPFLAQGGALMIEHGYQQSEQVQALMIAAGYHDVCSHADLAGILRVTEGRI